MMKPIRSITDAMEEIGRLDKERDAVIKQVEGMKKICAMASAHIIAVHNGLTPRQTDEQMVELLDRAVTDWLSVP